MKRSAWLLFVLLSITVSSNPVSAQEAAESAISNSGKSLVDIVPTTQSKEALVFFKQGLVASDMGENIKAHGLFSQAIAKDPNFGLAYLFRALAATTTKEYADDLNMGIKKTEKASAFEKMYADFLYTNVTGERDKGIAIAEKMAVDFPDMARSHTELGYAYYGNNQIDQAEKSFLKAIETNPSWAVGYSGLANLYMFSEKKDLAKAQENAQKAALLMPNSAGLHILLGDVYRAQNNFMKAKEEYQLAIKLDGKAPEGYFKLGHSNLYMDDIAEARKNYKDAGDRAPAKTFAQILQATTYAYAGDSKKAMQELMSTASKVAVSGGDKYKVNNAQLNLLSTAAEIAVHNGDAVTLKKLIGRIRPLSKENTSLLGTREAMLYDEANMLRWEVLLDAIEGKYTQALNKTETIKSILEPINDSRKMEGYHEALAQLHLRQKNYKEALGNLQLADPNSIYGKYLFAKAYEGMGDTETAMKYYTAVSNYNFNNTQNALVRFEVKNKLKNK